MSAMPIGAPGCPDLAFSTASRLKNLIAFDKSFLFIRYISYYFLHFIEHPILDSCLSGPFPVLAISNIALNKSL